MSDCLLRLERVKVKWTCKSVNPIGQYTIWFYFYKVLDIVSFESKCNLWCNSDVNNIWGVKIKSRQVYFVKELKTKNNVRKNSKRSLRASYLHDKALQTLFRGDNRVSKLYNCSNKSVDASEERLVSECCTVFFYLSVLLRLFCIINTLHVGVDYLIIYLLCRILGGGGWKFCLGGFGWTFCLGGL
jgi:hypothetical protein